MKFESSEVVLRMLNSFQDNLRTESSSKINIKVKFNSDIGQDETKEIVALKNR